MEPNNELKQRKTEPGGKIAYATTAASMNNLSAGGEEIAAPPPGPIRRRKSLSDRVKKEWDSLLWLFAAFAVFYFTNFASTLVFNELVNG